jgi:hypothetical protein
MLVFKKMLGNSIFWYPDILLLSDASKKLFHFG